MKIISKKQILKKKIEKQMILIIFPPVGIDHLEGAHSLTKTIVVRGKNGNKIVVTAEKNY